VATERQTPDSILSQSGFGSCVIGDLTSDPDAGDANWCVASGNNTHTDVRTSFPTPTGNPTVGADLQEFKAEVRQFDGGQSGTPDARIELWENGVLVRAGIDVAVTSSVSQIITFTWNANELATADGSLVECKVVGTKSGGSPSARNTVDVGGIEWNVTFDTGGTTFEQSVAGLLTPSGATVKETLKELAGSLASSGTLIKDIFKSSAGALAPTGALVKETLKSFAGSLSPSGVLSAIVIFTQSITGVLTPTGALIKRTLKSLTGLITPTGDITKQTQKNLSGLITPAGATIKETTKNFSGSITPTGVLTTAVIFTQTVLGALTPTGTLGSVFMAGGGGPVGAIYRRTLNLISIINHQSKDQR